MTFSINKKSYRICVFVTITPDGYRISYFFCFTIENYRKTWVIVTVKSEKNEIFTITGLSFSSYRNGEKWPERFSNRNLCLYVCMCVCMYVVAYDYRHNCPLAGCFGCKLRN